MERVWDESKKALARKNQRLQQEAARRMSEAVYFMSEPWVTPVAFVYADNVAHVGVVDQ